MFSKKTVKRILGEMPLTAELYWQLRQNGKPLSESFSCAVRRNVCRRGDSRQKLPAGAPRRVKQCSSLPL